MRVINSLGETRKMILSGKIRPALEIIEKNSNAETREKLMNTFVGSIIEYNEKIDWDDIYRS